MWRRGQQDVRHKYGYKPGNRRKRSVRDEDHGGLDGMMYKRGCGEGRHDSRVG